MPDNEIRDQLANAIEPVVDRWIDYHGLEFTNAPMTAMVEELIDAVSSWQPPRRVIETAEGMDGMADGAPIAEKLDALADGSVILVGKTAFQRVSPWWFIPGSEDPTDSVILVEDADGAEIVVLWEPEEADR